MAVVRPGTCSSGLSPSKPADRPVTSTGRDTGAVSMPGTNSPVEPPPSTWAFPRADSADADGVVGVGADVDPGTLLTAYRSGLFPMPV